MGFVGWNVRNWTETFLSDFPGPDVLYNTHTYSIRIFSFCEDQVILLKLLSKPEDDFSWSSSHPKMNKKLSLWCNRLFISTEKKTVFNLSAVSLHLSAMSMIGNIHSLGNNMVITCSTVESSWRRQFTYMIQIPPEQTVHFTVKRNWGPFCSLSCIQWRPHFKVSLGSSGFEY